MPTLQELNEDRKAGFRPSVLCCVVHENTVLILFNKEYSFWMFPQGGIENGENPEVSIFRALKEDFGETLWKIALRITYF
jgi:8-oxo-dGTP pyrophosphatase MutT (NUDIX family)